MLDVSEGELHSFLDDQFDAVFTDDAREESPHDPALLADLTAECRKYLDDE
jgi:hypothetical protein